MASYSDSTMEETETLFETDYVATGFMLIKREVVEKMQEHYKGRQFHYGPQKDPITIFMLLISMTLVSISLKTMPSVV